MNKLTLTLFLPLFGATFTAAVAADRTISKTANPTPTPVVRAPSSPPVSKGRAEAVRAVPNAVNRMKQSDVEAAKSSRVGGNSQSSSPTGDKAAGVAGAGRGYGPGAAPNDSKGKFGNSTLPARPGQTSSGRAPSGFGSNGFGGGPKSSSGRDPGQAFRSPTGISSGNASGSRPGSGNKLRPGAYGGDARLRGDSSESGDIWDSSESKSGDKSLDSSSVDGAVKKHYFQRANNQNQRAAELRRQADEAQQEAANSFVKGAQVGVPAPKPGQDDNSLGTGTGHGDGDGGKGPSSKRPDLNTAGKRPSRPGTPSSPNSYGQQGLVSGDGHGSEGQKGFRVAKPMGIQVSPKTDHLINPGEQPGN